MGMNISTQLLVVIRKMMMENLIEQILKPLPHIIKQIKGEARSNMLLSVQGCSRICIMYHYSLTWMRFS